MRVASGVLAGAVGLCLIAWGVAMTGTVDAAGLSVGPPATPSRAQAADTLSFASRRSERLLDRRVACLGCHRIGGRGGAIGPSLNGLGQRVTMDHVLSMILDPSGTVPGTIMPRQRMPEREAARLADYLVTRPPAPGPNEGVQPRAPPVLPPGEESNGSALYARHCAACHGDQGRGDGWNAAALPVAPSAHADPELMGLRPDDTLYDGIARGAFVLDGSPLMPAFDDLLSPEQIRALVAHIRTLCACEGPAWSRDSVAR